MLKEEIEIPESITVNLEEGRLNVKGSKGEVSKFFKNPHVKIQLSQNKITITSDSERKKIRATFGTWKAHIKNMFLGAEKGWTGELRLVYSHFPVKLKLEGNSLLIENFLGERNPRRVPVPEGLEVKVDKNTITVSGSDKEKVSQTCARIEQTAKVRGYDRRIFQDGIYITRKPYLEAEDEGKGRDAEGQEEN